MKKILLVLALTATTLGVVGCKAMRTHACLKPGAYAGAQNGQPLQVPAGMDAPETRGALRIPELSQPARVRAAAEGCLDAPPKFAPPKASPPAA